jgi:hypothetical protein
MNWLLTPQPTTQGEFNNLVVVCPTHNISISQHNQLLCPMCNNLQDHFWVASINWVKSYTQGSFFIPWSRFAWDFEQDPHLWPLKHHGNGMKKAHQFPSWIDDNINGSHNRAFWNTYYQGIFFISFVSNIAWGFGWQGPWSP